MVFQPIPREKVLAVIEKLGPVQPVDVRRELHEGDSMLIGAILSEMVANGMVAISKTKRGGSPFYYDPAKPQTLDLIAQFLGEKDRRTYDLLKEQGILREDSLEPLTRVSLGNIPDFSRRFTVALNGTDVAFWRHHLVPEEEARTRAQPSAPAAPVVTAVAPTEAEPPKKAVRKRASVKRPRKSAASSAPTPAAQQATLAPTVDAFAERVKARFGSGAVTELAVLKAESEATCVHTGPGPHGPIRTYVYACAKRLTEKAVLAQLLVARGRGMPLLVLSEDDLSKKLMELFDETPNVHHARI